MRPAVAHLAATTQPSSRKADCLAFAPQDLLCSILSLLGFLCLLGVGSKTNVFLSFFLVMGGLGPRNFLVSRNPGDPGSRQFLFPPEIQVRRAKRAGGKPREFTSQGFPGGI